MNCKVMLTGGTGYLGQALLKELLTSGYQIRALVRDPARLEQADGLEAVTGDLLDPASVARAADGTEVILHAGGLVSDWVPDARMFERVNVEGTKSVIAAARAVEVRRLVVTSTVMVFGPTDGLRVGHERTVRPHRAYYLPYQRSKARALDVCRRARGDDLAVTVLFPGALYGPGPLTDGNYLAQIMHKLETGAIPAFPRTDGLLWCLSHVEDVARGHRLALERGDPDGEYILGGDNVAFDRMLELMQSGLELQSLPRKVPAGLMLAGLAVLSLWHGMLGSAPPISMGGARALLHDWAFSSERARRDLGYTWQPFEEAFPRFVEWYAERREPATIAGP